MIDEIKYKLMTMPIRDFMIIGFILFFLFGLSVGRIIGEYEEMNYINSLINFTASDERYTLMNDYGYFKVTRYNHTEIIDFYNLIIEDIDYHKKLNSTLD